MFIINMEKTITITKESKDEGQNKLLVERKIKELKEEFKKFTQSRVGEMYRILSKIVELKKQTNSRYAPRSLEWDKDLNLTSGNIRYIFSHQYISTRSKELIEEGMINDSAVCFLIFRFKMLREPMWQNKLVKLFLDGEITISQTAEMTMDEIKQLLNGKLEFRTDDKYFISATKTLRSMLVRIKARKNVLDNSKFKEALVKEVEKIREALI